MGIYELFEKSALKNKDLVAVVCGKEEITYNELFAVTKQVMDILQNEQIHNEKVIIDLQRSPVLFAAMIACIAMGNSYVPIAENMPAERIKSIVKDCNPRVVLSDKIFNKDTYEGMNNIYSSDILNVEIGNKKHIEIKNKYSDGGYCIYTSGTTGKPKGVVIKEKSLVEFIKGFDEAIKFEEQYTILAATSFAFDIFFIESVFALVKGWKVVLAGENEMKNPFRILELIRENSINLIQMTPSRLQQLLIANKNKSDLNGLKLALVGGELFPPKLFYEFRKINECRLMNVYGPTESTIWCACCEVSDETIDEKYGVSIGKPFYNVTFLLEQRDNQKHDDFTKGELLIGGTLLAEKYENRPEITEEKFIEKNGKKYYLTGDICAKKNDSYYILGRNDNQIKFNGYRIELEEIERITEKVPGVQKCIARAIEVNNKVRGIELFYITDREEVLRSDIVNVLKEYLPEYMIPEKIIKVKEFPQNSNGKVDRNNIKESNMNKISGCTEPEYEVIVSMMQDITENRLDVDANAKLSDYLNSLEIVQLIVEIEERFGIEIDENQIYDLYTGNLIRLVHKINELVMKRHPKCMKNHSS